MTGKQKKTLLRIIASAVMMAALIIWGAEGWIGFGLWMLVYLLIGYDILWRALTGIFSGQIFDENFLMAIATVGAIVLALMGRGDYVEAVAVMLFYQVGEFFQSYAVRRSRRNIGALMDIRPDYANVESDGRIERLSPEDVAVGSIMVVNPGERIAIDGTVVSGESSLDTAALTGESMPRSVCEGDKVSGGCINLSGVIRVRTDREFGESTVSRILDLVENASSRKARSENFISKFAAYYTPAVCAGALLLAILPPLVLLAAGDEPAWMEWLYRALTFLVISCPCALVVSIPLSFFSGLGGASREGILIKGSSFIELLSKVDCVALDKTGTLTKGSFEVSEIHGVGMSESELLFYAAHAESASSHPIAKSLLAAYGKEIDRARVDAVREQGGKGVSALVDGRKVLAGNARLMEDSRISFESAEAAATAVYVAVDGRYVGYILISDVIKEDAEAAIRALRSAGVKRIVMLTGDGDGVATSVAARLGLDEVHSRLLPDKKVEALEALLGGRGRTAFAGDGINDAPVLARADIGIAMGAMGSDAAIEAADAVIMDDDVKKLALAIRISKKCMRIVYQNIAFAIGVKLLCLALGALGIANMYLAIFADVGVMVLAVLNAVRAMLVKKV